MRLDKYLCECTAGVKGVTRSEAKKKIKSGRVTVDGEVCKKAEFNVDEENSIVTLDGNELSYEKFSYFLLYKPAGCVTAITDNRYPTVMDYIEDEDMKKGLAPVGRLDLDTEGLLLITNDGALTHKLISPSHHVPKCYEAVLDKAVPKDAIARMKEGIDIGDDKPTLPAELIIDENDSCHAFLTIYEGRYHQVKRMFEAFGCTVTYLKRLSMGPLSLSDLEKGAYRRLTDEEKELLFTV